jgi:hypothetical protein
MFQGGGGLQGRSFVFKQFTNYECADSVITEAIWQRFPATLDCVSEGATMRKRLLTTMLALLLISAPAAARVKAKKHSHKAKAVATRQVAQDTVRTPPQPAPKPIAPLPVLLVILAGVVATAFVSFAKALSPAREAGEKAEIRAHASAHSPSARSVGVATAGIAVAQRFQVDAHQFGKARLVSLP